MRAIGWLDVPSPPIATVEPERTVDDDVEAG